MLAGLLAAGCTARNDKASLVDEGPTAELARLREHARQVLEENCGACHLPDLASSLPGALRVFDLSAEQWAAHMSAAQLWDAENRLGSDRAPGGEDGTPMAVSADDRRLFRRYVELEIARRQRGED